MSDARVTRALVAGHGDFAAGLISAVEQITGRGDMLEPIQVKGLCGEDIQQLLRDTARWHRRAGDLHRPAGGQLHDGGAAAAARQRRRRARRPARTCRCCSTSCCRASPIRSRRRARAVERGAERDRRAYGGRGVTLVLNRIDDRLIHGQVVVGWGQPLDVGFIVLVDDAVAESDWEQELYRMGVPPEMEVRFHSAAEAAPLLDRYRTETASGHPAHRRHRHDAPARAARRRARGERRRHPPSRRSHAVPALRLPHRGRADARCATSPRCGALVTAQDVPGGARDPARGDARRARGTS